MVETVIVYVLVVPFSAVTRTVIIEVTVVAPATSLPLNIILALAFVGNVNADANWAALIFLGIFFTIKLVASRVPIRVDVMLHAEDNDPKPTLYTVVALDPTTLI
jgi:hypothetical protein